MAEEENPGTQDTSTAETSSNSMDFLIYAGDINRKGYNQLCKLFNSEPAGSGSQRALLILATYGGDPHAAFRICRALQHHYPEGFSLFIPEDCKSAGTLIAIGADSLILSDTGELGPLDVQISKPDELFDSSSGLDLPQAIENLQAHAKKSFRQHLFDTRLKTGLSTSMAAKIATDITVGLFSPIFGQIDPTRVGETQRANMIGYAYGEKLNHKFKNLKKNALEELTVGYPSHGFVIDRKEARELFNRVEAPNQELQSIADELHLLLAAKTPSSEPHVDRFADTESEEQPDTDVQAEDDDEPNASYNETDRPSDGQNGDNQEESSERRVSSVGGQATNHGQDD